VQLRRMATEPGRATKASETPTLKVGDAAPDFTLTSHTNAKFTLSEHRGTNVVVAFYPFAFTGT
jgi:peroxiredoxin